jgi:cell volume regulation protein A
MAAIIGLGLLGNLLNERWRIPDVMALIGLGVLLGPLLDIFPPAAFAEVAPTFGAFALLVIMFDAGLSIRFSELRRGLAPAAYLAAAGFGLTVLAVAAALSVGLGWPAPMGLLLGAILGGSSSIIVVPALQRLRAPDRLRVALSFESALTDVLCVVGTLVIAGMIASGNVSAEGFGASVAYSFAVAAAAGAAAGACWLFLWPRLEGRAFAYMITLAAIIAVDVGVEYAGGSGPIGVLLFGLVLGNEFRLRRRVTTSTWHMEGEMRRFHGEIVFFFRAFFFVGLGVLIRPDLLLDPSVLLLGALVVGALVAARAAAAYLLGLASPELRSNRWLAFLMMPRGLAAAVLATAPAVLALPGTDHFLAVAFLTILSTNAIAMAAPFAPRPAAFEAGPDGVGAALEARRRADSERRERQARLEARAARLEAEQAVVDRELAAVAAEGREDPPGPRG